MNEDLQKTNNDLSQANIDAQNLPNYGIKSQQKKFMVILDQDYGIDSILTNAENLNRWKNRKLEDERS